MRTLTRNQKTLAALATAAIVLGGSGTAYAYWTSTGSGDGTGTTTAGASNLSIVQTSRHDDLAPGVAAETIQGTVTNNAVNNAYVTQVDVSIASVTKAANAPAGACDASDYSLANTTMAVRRELAPGGSFAFAGATLAFNDKATNQDGCKGATVTLHYAAS